MGDNRTRGGGYLAPEAGGELPQVSSEPAMGGARLPVGELGLRQRQGPDVGRGFPGVLRVAEPPVRLERLIVAGADQIALLEQAQGVPVTRDDGGGWRVVMGTATTRGQVDLYLTGCYLDPPEYRQEGDAPVEAVYQMLYASGFHASRPAEPARSKGMDQALQAAYDAGRAGTPFAVWSRSWHGDPAGEAE